MNAYQNSKRTRSVRLVDRDPLRELGMTSSLSLVTDVLVLTRRVLHDLMRAKSS